MIAVFIACLMLVHLRDLELSLQQTANVRFNLRISQNRRWADKNSSEKLLWLKLARIRSFPCSYRTIFVWPGNENVRTKQKQQTNGNRAIWWVYRTDTNARGPFLVKRTLGWKNFMPENFLEINRYFALTSYCNTIGQSNNAFSILGFSLAGKRRVHVLIFSSIGWQHK